MSRRPEIALRGLSILVSVIVACVLAYGYQMSLPSLVYVSESEPIEMHEMRVVSLLVFVTIPMLGGFVVGMIDPENAVINGLYAGLISGVVNSIMASLKTLFVYELGLEDIYAFAFFAIMSIFLWMVVTAATALLGREIYA